MKEQQQKTPQFGVRLPADLKRWLEEQAAANHRSLNGEVVARLELSQKQERRGAKTAA